MPMVSGRAKSPLHSLRTLSAFYTGGSVAVHPDGTDLICVCGDELKVVNRESGAVTRSLPGDSEPLTAMCVHPSGGLVVTSSRSLVSKVWSLRTGRCTRAWKPHTAPVADIAFDVSGGYIATASTGREVKVWDTDAGFCTHSMVCHTGIVMRVLFHPNKALLATSGDDGFVTIVDLTSKTVKFKLKGHVSVVSAIAWTSDGEYLLSAGRDKVVVLWDTRSGTKVRSIAVLESVDSVIIIPPSISKDVCGSDSGGGPCIIFATGGEAGVVKLWNAQTGQCVANTNVASQVDETHAIIHLAMMPYSQKILSATADCTLTFMSVCGKTLTSDSMLLGNLGEVTSTAFLYNALAVQRGEDAGAPDKESTDAAQQGCVVIATNHRSFYQLSSSTFRCTNRFEGHSDIVLCVAAQCFHTTSATIWLVASGSKDNTVRVWHAEAGRCLAVASGHLGSVNAVSFFSQQSPSLLSGGADKLIQIWDLSSVLQLLDLGTFPQDPLKLSASAAVAGHEKEINCVAVSPSNALAASGGADRVVRIWKLPALSTPMVLTGHKRGVWDVQFAPVDQAILTASGDATLRIWSAKDGMCIRTFVGHGASVLRARFSAAGSKIVSSGSDGLLKVWNAKTGHCVFTQDAHDGKVWAMDVGGPNQSFAISGADNGSLTLWGDGAKVEADTEWKKHEYEIQEQQILDNAVMAKQWVEAAKRAIRLQKPAKLLLVTHEILKLKVKSPTDVLDFCLITRDLRIDDLRTLLMYIRDYNTSPKHFHCAHALLHAVLMSRHPQELSETQGLQDVLDGLHLYSSRHYDRLDRLLQSTFLLDYIQLQSQGYNRS
eukprot:jgi/Ulvmu1/4170/UM019_0149.1